jgi:predicted hotdog family 3-hydroxylacyl-ACP dehydratase
MSYTEFNFKDYSIEELIPHSGPMVLIEEVLEYSEQHLVAEIKIQENCKFYDAAKQGVPAWVGVEYMSQAIAALAGIYAKQQGREIKLGFLLGTRKYNIQQTILKKDHVYRIEVSQLYKDDSGLASFDCKILENNSVQQSDESMVECVRAKLNVFETNDLQDIVEK